MNSYEYVADFVNEDDANREGHQQFFDKLYFNALHGHNFHNGVRPTVLKADLLKQFALSCRLAGLNEKLKIFEMKNIKRNK